MKLVQSTGKIFGTEAIEYWPSTVLQNWKSVKLKCGVLGHCVTILVHQYHALTSEIEIISIGIHDLAASQHQFLDDTKHFVTSKNWCWLAAKSWIPIDMISISLVEAWYWCTKSGKQHPNTPHFSWTLFQFWSTVPAALFEKNSNRIWTNKLPTRVSSLQFSYWTVASFKVPGVFPLGAYYSPGCSIFRHLPPIAPIVPFMALIVPDWSRPLVGPHPQDTPAWHTRTAHPQDTPKRHTHMTHPHDTLVLFKIDNFFKIWLKLMIFLNSSNVIFCQNWLFFKFFTWPNKN